MDFPILYLSTYEYRWPMMKTLIITLLIIDGNILTIGGNLKYSTNDNYRWKVFLSVIFFSCQMHQHKIYVISPFKRVYSAGVRQFNMNRQIKTI